jgi:hypothetical protein
MQNQQTRAGGLTPGQIGAVAAGNALEFYDFLTFGFFATQIGKVFFPLQNESSSLLLSLATFGVGFLVRPLGGILIGRMGDRRGRKPAMLFSFGLMGFSIVGLALTPVRDLVVLDPYNTRSVGFQVFALRGHLTALPALVEDGLMEPPNRILRLLAAEFETAVAGDIDADVAQRFEETLLDLAMAVADRYFLQGATAVPTVKIGGLG